LLRSIAEQRESRLTAQPDHHLQVRSLCTAQGIIISGKMLMSQVGKSSQQESGIEKRMSWKLLFFVAACCTVAAAVISITYLISNFEFAPCSFLSEIFLLFFGCVMLALDIPIADPIAALGAIRFHTYKFMLFLTRFTGRGLWYVFLGTMIWGALWDLNISWFLGFSMGLYVILLGIVSMVYGFRLSFKLDNVRKALMDGSSKPPDCPEGGFSKEQFKENVLAVHTSVGSPTQFTDDEVDYIMNGLSFTATNDGLITMDEYWFWLQPGTRMSIV